MGSINDIYLLQVRGTLLGQQYIHTLHFKSAVVGTDAAIQQDLIDSWQAAAQTAWRAAHPAWYTLSDITAQRVCGSLPLPAETAEVVALAGNRAGGSGDGLAPWLSGLCRERTGFAGRRYAGRFFMSGLQEGDIDGDNLQAGYVTVMTAYCTALAPFLVGGADADWDLFVRSRVLAAQPGVACQDTGAGVTSVTPSAILTTQKSRRA
jgi:hypothetical protein